MAGVRRWFVAAAVVAALMVVCLAMAGRPEGTAKTDQQAARIAQTISWPRQTSAAGLARAALPGLGPRSSVLEARDLPADRLTDARARLVIRLHADASDFDLTRRPGPVTACYRMEFNYYGVIGRPHRIVCPANATPYTPPPPPPEDFRDPYPG